MIGKLNVMRFNLNELLNTAEPVLSPNEVELVCSSIDLIVDIEDRAEVYPPKLDALTELWNKFKDEADTIDSIIVIRKEERDE